MSKPCFSCKYKKCVSQKQFCARTLHKEKNIMVPCNIERSSFDLKRKIYMFFYGFKHEPCGVDGKFWKKI